MNGIQVQLGKAFEYACLESFNNILGKSQEILVNKDDSYIIAKNYYNNIDVNYQKNMLLAGVSAVDILTRLEPFLLNTDNDIPLYLTIQPDIEGISGDVRDILLLRKGHDWKIGLSVKHNHTALKHSRLSNQLNFGKSWFNISCSHNYFDEILPIFQYLKELKKQEKLWSEIHNKMETIYLPILKAFNNEILRLDATYPNIISNKLLEYVIGKHDFYKIISHDSRRMTQVQAFSLYGTLNKASGKIKPQITVPRLKLPSRIYSTVIKPESMNTLLVILDQGWQLSFRIHNASSLVEPSLKFDITLVGNPDIFTHFQDWGNNESILIN